MARFLTKVENILNAANKPRFRHDPFVPGISSAAVMPARPV
ncbi:hypothetical protein [Methanooceanicella nereidis]|nr:hypothetical protein [Methanocella sp. CWC-04]